MKYSTHNKHGVCLLIVMLFSLFHVMPASAISMKVGDVELLSLGSIPRLQGCVWTISRPNDVVFTTTPSSYSTDVFIKAVNTFPSSSPCIVQCKYYYLEQDPTTGKYTYSRTGYKDWEVYVTSGGSGGSNEGGSGGNSSLRLKVIEASIVVDEWLTVDAMTSSSSNLSWSLSNTACAYFVKKTNTQIKVRGVCSGVTKVICKDSNGNIATCDITITPRSIASYSVGDYIYAEAEGMYGKKYTTQYSITNTEDPQCTLVRMGGEISTDRSFKGDYIVPFEVAGFKVTGIKSDAFYKCNNMNSIVIHGGVKEIGSSVFSQCDNLVKVDIEEGVEIIGWGCFNNCSKLEELTIPSTITEIGNWVFWGVDKVHVKCYVNPPFDVGEILPVPTEQILYVPYGTKTLYENASGWNAFKNIIEMSAQTNINEVTNKDKKGNGKIYTIGGQLMNEAVNKELPKGIYLIDGKKVYIK